MEKKPIKISGRQRLLAYFRNGKIPSEEHYSDLINSMVHKDDDGFSKDDENGLKIYADEKYNSLISFYKNINAIDPFFVMGKDKTDPDALKIQPIDDSDDPTVDTDATSVFLHTNGKVGIGKKCEPKYKMEVDGFIGMGGRIGTYKSGAVTADGNWQPIITGLKNAQAFEVIARAGKKGTGKYAIMHATALSIFGPKGGKIRRTNGYYGWFWNKIKLRWTGDSSNYALEIKVGSNYGEGIEIFYTVSRLWDDSLFLSDDYYYSDRT
ncbi:hypothetical protein ACFGVR_19935 [Mucilaginibacter sp. AW1-3]